MKRTFVVMTLCTLLAPVAPVHADIDKAGTTAANFLSVGQGASVLGMGGATLGFGADLNTAYWNSASLTRLTATQIVFSHASLDQENNQEWAAVGGRWGADRFWSATGLYQGNGSFDGRDALGNPTGTFNASSIALGLNMAQRFSSNVSVGLGAQFVNETLGDVSGSGVTFNAGVQMQRGIWGLGAAAQNVFGKMTYSGVPYAFPGNYGMGVSVSDPTRGLRFALDLNFPDAYYSDVRTGVEWRYKEHLALRTGYRKELGAQSGEPLGGPTFGMGAGSNGFWFDYGLVMGGSGATAEHRIGLTYRPGLNSSVPGTRADGTANPPASEPAVAATTATDTQAKKTKSGDAPAGQTLAAEPVMDQAPPRPASTTSTAKPTPTGSDAAKTATTKAAPSGVKYVAPVGAGIAIGTTATSKPAPASTSTTTPTKPAATPATTAPATAAPAPPAKPAATPPTTAPATATPKSIAPVSTAPVATGTSGAAGAVAVTTTSVAAKEVAAPSNTKELAAPSNTKELAAPSDTKELATSSSTKTAEKPAEMAAVTPVATEVAKPAAVTPSPSPAAAAPPAAAPVTQSVSDAPKPVVAAPVAAAPEAKPVQQVAKPEVATPAPAKRPSKVKVGKGETMADIAQKWGTSSAAIMMENNLVTDKVKPGMELKLPPAGRK